MSKNFSIFKNTHKKEGSTAPDYKMSTKVGEEFVECGACWLKDSPKGGKYFSCKLSDLYVDKEKGTARQGFDLIAEPLVEEKKEPCIDPVSGVNCAEIPF